MSAKMDVAIHEAGHAVIALDEGIELGEYVERELRGGFCTFTKDTAKVAADPALWVPKYIKALLAGQIAQEKYVNEQGDSILDDEREAWAEDNRRCLVAAEQGIGLDDTAAIDTIRSLYIITRGRIDDPRIWSAIKAVARELNGCRRLAGKAVEAIFMRTMSV